MSLWGFPLKHFEKSVVTSLGLNGCLMRFATEGVDKISCILSIIPFYGYMCQSVIRF